MNEDQKVQEIDYDIMQVAWPRNSHAAIFAIPLFHMALVRLHYTFQLTLQKDMGDLLLLLSG